MVPRMMRSSEPVTPERRALIALLAVGDKYQAAWRDILTETGKYVTARMLIAVLLSHYVGLPSSSAYRLMFLASEHEFDLLYKRATGRLDRDPELRKTYNELKDSANSRIL